jgi:hypothetical protein
MALRPSRSQLTFGSDSCLVGSHLQDFRIRDGEPSVAGIASLPEDNRSLSLASISFRMFSKTRHVKDPIVTSIPTISLTRVEINLHLVIGSREVHSVDKVMSQRSLFLRSASQKRCDFNHWCPLVSLHYVPVTRGIVGARSHW